MMSAVLLLQQRHLNLVVALASSDILVLLLFFSASLSSALAFIILRLLGGGVRVGDGDHGVCSGVATSLSFILLLVVVAHMCSWENLSVCRQYGTLDPGREEKGPPFRRKRL
jgi:hypothetical protein